jgi:uncharacterized protein YdeI (YjbR/CyaY-like superfamily)
MTYHLIRFGLYQVDRTRPSKPLTYQVASFAPEEIQEEAQDAWISENKKVSKKWPIFGRIVVLSLEGPVTVPADLQEALGQHPEARLWFDRLSGSKQKWFVDRIEQVTEAAARSRRVAEVIQQLERIGQSRQQ